MEGGGVAGHIRKVLSCSTSGGDVVWSGEVVAIGANVADMGLMQQVTKSKEKRLMDGLWKKAAARKILQGVET